MSEPARGLLLAHKQIRIGFQSRIILLDEMLQSIRTSTSSLGRSKTNEYDLKDYVELSSASKIEAKVVQPAVYDKSSQTTRHELMMRGPDTSY